MGRAVLGTWLALKMTFVLSNLQHYDTTGSNITRCYLGYHQDHTWHFRERFLIDMG